MQTVEIIAMAERRKVIRATDLEEIGASRTLLPYLAEKGALRRITRGAYAPSDYVPEHETFLEIAAAVPRGVVCLLSALQFHEITTQMPLEGWVAIERGRYMPATHGTPIRIVKFSGPAFMEGIEEHDIGGITVRIYSPAKTIVDCFKFRNRIGLDVAREALLDALEQKKTSRDEIWRYAKCCRMSNVMRPYLEMVT